MKSFRDFTWSYKSERLLFLLKNTEVEKKTLFLTKSGGVLFFYHQKNTKKLENLETESRRNSRVIIAKILGNFAERMVQVWKL